MGCLVLLAGPAQAERRVALVVGNSAYQYVSRLDNPANDARLMADTLRGLGFTLARGGALIDLSKSDFDAAIQDFGNQIAGADVALFYYAGHGIQVRGSNHLVPINANPTKEADVDFQMVDVALVLRQMEGSGTRLNLVILDACRNNPFGGRGLRSSAGGLAQMSAAEGTLVSYATQPGSVAQDGTDGNSPFTKALVQTLRLPGVGLFDVFNQVGLSVKRSTGGSQQPWVSSSPIDGTFYFVPPPSADRPSSAGDPALSQAAQSPLSAAKNTSGIVMLDPQKSQARVGAGYVGPGQRAVLFDEDPSDPKGKQYVGSVVWRTDQVKGNGSQKPDVAVRADIEIPDRKFKMTMSFRRNTDSSLPASHTVELTFILPSDFSGGGVSNVPGILMKSNEQARGTPLAGLTVKVTDGFFLVGLSNVDADRQRNVRLLKERSWFDVPLIYTNQRRAILAIERGTTGDEAFQAALSAWGQLQQSDQSALPPVANVVSKHDKLLQALPPAAPNPSTMKAPAPAATSSEALRTGRYAVPEKWPDVPVAALPKRQPEASLGCEDSLSEIFGNKLPNAALLLQLCPEP
jgi:hypothetical protein